MHRTHIRDEPARPYDGLFVNCVKIHELETLTLTRYWPQNCRIKISYRFLYQFRSNSFFLRKRIFAIFTYIFAYNSIPLFFFKI